MPSPAIQRSRLRAVFDQTSRKAQNNYIRGARHRGTYRATPNRVRPAGGLVASTRSRLVPFLLVVVVAGMAQASALPLFPISGTLRPRSDPLEASGAVTVQPVEHETTTAFLRALEQPPAGDQTLLRADKVSIIVRQWFGPVGDTDGKTQTTPGLPDPDPRHIDAEDAVLGLHGWEDLPQVRIDVAALKGRLSGLTADAAACGIDNPAAVSPMHFPQDPNQVSRTRRSQIQPAERQLTADCRLPHVSASNPTQIDIYGIDILLDQAGKEPEIIRTGTYDENVTGDLPASFAGLNGPPRVLPPVPRKVTTILEVHLTTKPIAWDFPVPSEVRLHAEAFAAVGQLGVGVSEGRLTWGALDRQGEIEPFQTRGEFEIAWAESQHVAVEGQTLDAPAGIAAGKPPTARVVLAVAAGAVGLGLLALAVRALWPLFSNLAPDRVLDHPRRSQILEYVRRQPGVGTNTVARALGLRWANVVHHVGKLEHGGHVVVRRFGGRTSLFPANAGLRGREEAIALLRRDTERRLHEFLLSRPGTDQARLATELGLSQQRISQSLRRLEAVRLVRRHRTGRRTGYFADPIAMPPGNPFPVGS